MSLENENTNQIMRNAALFNFRFNRQAWGILALFLFIFVFSVASVQGESADLLQQTITQKQESVERLKREMATYAQSIRLRQSQATSLSNQIAILNDQIQRLELSIQATTQEIELTELQITETERIITEREQALVLKRSELAAGIRDLWQREQQGELTILLAYDNVSDFFKDLEYVEQLQARVGDTVREFDRLKKEAQLKREELVAKQSELENLHTELDEQQFNLTGQRSVKAQILVDTRRSETQYQRQLDQAKRQQAAIEADIASYEKKLRDEIAKTEKAKRLQAVGVTQFIWPVPSNTITAFFHDPDYPYRYIFEHPAVDIKAGQGTPVKAAAAGYVARAKNGGYGYSYIMLIHNDGYATVYGHVSKILVQDDEFVEQGQVIALSGGMPGTPGAGGLTTGPHMHFEIRQQGIPINPLDYLP